MTTRQALWAVIGVSAALRLALAVSLGGLIDEAYYVLYARHLSWSFFDHPPMVALVAAAGEAIAGWVNPLVGVRVAVILLFAGSTWLMARLTARFFSPRAGVLAALVLNSTIYFGLVVGTTAGPDAPLLFFWLLTLDRLAVALGPRGRTSTWLAVGLAWGGAMLSKYHGVLLPAGAVLYLVLRPPARLCLRTPGPYLATAVGLAAFSPVVFWNAAHGWPSFLFHARRTGGFQGFRPEFVLEAVVGQMAYLFPWFWVCLVAVLVRQVRRGPRRWTDGEAFLTCQSVPALALFMGVSTFTRIMAYWPLIGFVALIPMLGQALLDRLDARPVPVRRRIAAWVSAPVVLAGLFVAQANFGLFQDARGRLAALIPASDDPTVDTIRWDQIARELERRGLCDEPNTFLFTDNWRYSAELALATRYQVPVACFHRDARGFTFWSRREDWVGRDGIYVRVFDGIADPRYYAPWFTRIEPIAEFPVVRAGCTLETVLIFRCVRQTDPFAFGFYENRPMPRPDDPPEPGDPGGQAVARTPGVQGRVE